MKRLSSVLVVAICVALVGTTSGAAETPTFAKHVEVFGIHIYATAASPNEKLLHAANVLAQYLDNRLSRRGFFRRMAAAGFTASFIESMLSELAQAETLANEGSESYRIATGTGGELLVEQLKAARVKYVFTNPGSTEVGLFDA